MNILSIESSFDICGASLVINNEHVGTLEKQEPKIHSKLLAVYINEIIENNGVSIKDIDSIAVSIGPGSYTGLRIGISLAKGLAMPYNIPIFPISTFEIAKFQIKKEKKYSIAYHSHRDFIYSCSYDNENILSKPQICKIDEIVSDKIFGYGLEKISEKINFIEIIPSSIKLADYVLSNANNVLSPIHQITPIYLS